MHDNPKAQIPLFASYVDHSEWYSSALHPKFIAANPSRFDFDSQRQETYGIRSSFEDVEEPPVLDRPVNSTWKKKITKLTRHYRA